MKCLEVSEREGLYVARPAEAEEPAPKSDEVLVRVAGSGVNRADLSQIAGKYPPPPGESPILGLEVSGTVAGTGEPVCAILAGRWSCGNRRRAGGAARETTRRDRGRNDVAPR